MRKKTFVAALAILLIFAVLTGFFYSCSLQNRTNPNPLARPEKMFEKALYVTSLRFDSTVGLFRATEAVLDEKYNHFELVQSEADAAIYGDDVIVA